MKHSLTVGQVARRVALKPSAIRYYEAHGILPSCPRLPNGYRVYGEDTVAQLNLLRRAQAFGMTLDEIKELLELTARGSRPCERVRHLARRRLAHVDLKIRELELLRDQLRRLVRRRAPRAMRPGELCPMIERAAL